MDATLIARGERVALGLLLVLLLAVGGFVFGYTILSFTTGIAVSPHGAAPVQDSVILGCTALFSIAGAALAWKASLSTVRIALAIVGVVVTSVMAFGGFLAWARG